MSLKIFYGTDRFKLDLRCKEIISHCAGRNILLIVPEQFSLSAERNFSDITKIGFEVISFKRLAGKIFEESGRIIGSYLSSSSKIMLMQSVLELEKLGIYSSSAEKEGFAAMLTKTVSEFKHAAIGVEFIKSKTENSEGILREKLSDFSVIYESFNKKIEQFGNDADDDLTFAYEILLKNPKLYSIADSVIIINKFSGFTKQERMLIRLFESICDVYITVSADALDESASVCFEATVNNIKSITDGINYTIEKTEDSDEFSAPSHLSSNYFKYPPETSDSHDVIIYKFSDAYKEVNAVAQEIIRLCREENMRFMDIAVCYRNADEYKRLTERIFKNNGIPVFLDNKENISSNAFIVFIYLIADLFEYNYSCESLSGFVKSVFSPVSQEDADLFENFILAHGIFGKKFSDDETWNKKTSIVFGNNEILKEKINGIRKSIIIPLKKFRENTKGRHSYETHARYLFGLLSEFGVYSKLEEIINKFNDKEQFREAKDYSQIWNIFINILDEAVKFIPNTETTFIKFINVIKSGLNECSTGAVPPLSDCVSVSDAQRFVPGEIKVLFILGVCSGEFPPPSPSGGLFDEADREILSGLGIELSNAKKHIALAEQQILYKIFSAPSEKIYFSYRTTNSDGTAAAPGEIISKIKNIFPEIPVITELPEIGSPYYTFERLAKERITCGNVFDWFISNLDWYRRTLLITGRKSADGNVKLSEESVKKLYENGFSGSVSKLETYSKCAFSYFLNYNLKLKPRKIYTLSAPDIGTLAHSVLEKCVRDTAEKNIWDEITREKCDVLTENAMNNEASVFLGGILLSSPRYRYILSKLTKQLSNSLYYILNRFGHSKFRPEGFEIIFDSNAHGRTVCGKNGEKIRLTGKIDRTDSMIKDGNKYIRVVDYKTGNKELKIKDVYNAANLQLITYLDALCGENNIPAGVMYCILSSAVDSGKNIMNQKEIEAKLKGRYAMRGLVLENNDIISDMDDDSSYLGIEGRKKGGTASEEQFRLLRLSVRKSIKELSDSVLEGDISINPPCIRGKSENNPCDYCDYSNICRGICSRKKLKRFDNDEDVYNALKEEFGNE